MPSFAAGRSLIWFGGLRPTCPQSVKDPRHLSCFQNLESIGLELSRIVTTWPIRRRHLLHRRLAHARRRSERHLLSIFLTFIFSGLLLPTAP
ncbi:hypothetical protein BHM03_00052239 [Ensete ventricosum]|nr:hypothetical protein BHM03_00052239 [Ensete ventricosum]